MMKSSLPIIFLIVTIGAFILNLFGLMQFIPMFITLPILFISIYLTVYSFMHPRVYRGMR
ncbi:hypothetical protein ACLIBG_02730 [Virgibacillus sp. W0181]|uniref:hypothetical protein n=1 Tax=Virgibacillus sp. W0181 TaxID=3391581 RepID=UPI003F47FBAD